MKKVVCLGNMTNDILLHVNDIPKLDDVAMVNDSSECMGGRGAIVALILGVLGVGNDLITVLPKSTKVEEYKLLLKNNGVSIENISTDIKSSKLFQVTGVISKVQKNCISFFEPSQICFEISENHVKSIANADIAYFTTHNKKFNLELLNSVTPKTYIIHNACDYFIRSDEYFNAMMARSHMLIMNQNEYLSIMEKLEIISEKDIFEHSKALDTLIITRGVRGASVFKRSTEDKIDFLAYEVDEVAPIGAGDSFVAGIIFSLVQELDWETGVRFANLIAGLSVNSSTTYPNIERLNELKDMEIWRSL